MGIKPVVPSGYTGRGLINLKKYASCGCYSINVPLCNFDKEDEACMKTVYKRN
jgi:hypothetical protein